MISLLTLRHGREPSLHYQNRPSSYYNMSYEQEHIASVRRKWRNQQARKVAACLQ